MALKSIYQELLLQAEEVQNYQSGEDFAPSGFIGEDYEDMSLAEYDSGVGDLIYLPIKRHFLEQDGLQYDISGVLSHTVKHKIPNKVLDEYIDGAEFKQYPVAVSFLMKRHDYLKLLNETSERGLFNIITFHHGMHTAFSCGKIMSVSGDADTVAVIAGFEREGEDIYD